MCLETLLTQHIRMKRISLSPTHHCMVSFSQATALNVHHIASCTIASARANIQDSRMIEEPGSEQMVCKPSCLQPGFDVHADAKADAYAINL